MTTSNQSIQTLTPRCREIMLRVIRGQSQKMIAQDLSISQGRISIIINSPLFQIELKKMMSKREEQLFTIQETFLDAAELGVKFHKEVLGAPVGTHPTDVKLKSATTMTVLASRLLRPITQPSNGDGEESELGYEERLRKVTIEESIKTVPPSHPQPASPTAPTDEINNLLESAYPPSTDLEVGMEEDVLFGEVRDDDDIFNPPVKIEDTLNHAAGNGGKG